MMEPDLPIRPPLEPITLLRELSRYVCSGESMSQTSSKMLRSAVTDQQNKIKLILAAIGSHKISRLAKLAAALDLATDKLTSATNVAKAAEEPSELRKLVRLLKDLEISDVNYLMGMTAETAEQKGHTADPHRLMHTVINIGTVQGGGPEVPADLELSERRNVQHLLSGLMSMATNGPPTPPSTDTHKERALLVERILSDDEQQSGNGQQPPRRATEPPQSDLRGSGP